VAHETVRWDVLDQGSGCYALRGHTTAGEAADMVALFHSSALDEGTPLVAPLPNGVRHEWWRAVPGEEGTDYHAATPESKGAFRVTVAWWGNEPWEAIRRQAVQGT
jgi:hypothetical protein